MIQQRPRSRKLDTRLALRGRGECHGQEVLFDASSVRSVYENAAVRDRYDARNGRRYTTVELILYTLARAVRAAER